MSFFSLALLRSSLFFFRFACLLLCSLFSFLFLACLFSCFPFACFFFVLCFFFFFFLLSPPLAGCLLACFPSNSSSSHSFAHCATRRQENICEYGLLFFFPFFLFKKKSTFFVLFPVASLRAQKHRFVFSRQRKPHDWFAL
jgi:hypothetical protein